MAKVGFLAIIICICLLYVPNAFCGQAEILGEVGSTTIDSDAKLVAYRNNYCYTDPVVVAKPISCVDPSPAVVRVWNVTRFGFNIRIQNFIYGSVTDNHGLENIGYIVMEKGRHVLQSGISAEAGLVNISRDDPGSEPFITVNFSEPFVEVPVILTSCNSINENETVITRIKDVTTTGFKLTLQEKESSDQTHAEEQVAYIAISPIANGAIGSDPGIPLEVARPSLPIVDGIFRNILFIHSYGFLLPFSSPPIVIADMQTTEPEGSPAELRVGEVTRVLVEFV